MDSRDSHRIMNKKGVTSTQSPLTKLHGFVMEHKAVVMASLVVGFLFLLTFSMPSRADTIWNVAQTASESLITNIKDLYCKAIFPLLFVLDLILLALTKDEKKLAIEKRALLILVIVFVAIYGVFVIRDTVLGLSKQVEGASGGI